MPIIIGNQGPYPANAPGAHGANASYQVLLHQKDKASLTKLAESSIQITPEDSFVKGQLSKPGLDDYFGYAKADIAQFDKDQDGKLSKEELATGFGGGPNASPQDQQFAQVQANQLYRAADQDGEPGLSAIDMTSYLIAQDAPKQLYAGFGYDDLLNAAQQQYQQHYQQFYPGETLPDMT